MNLSDEIINLLKDVNICEGNCPHCSLTAAGDICLCERAGILLDKIEHDNKRKERIRTKFRVLSLEKKEKANLNLDVETGKRITND